MVNVRASQSNRMILVDSFAWIEFLRDTGSSTCPDLSTTESDRHTQALNGSALVSAKKVGYRWRTYNSCLLGRRHG